MVVGILHEKRAGRGACPDQYCGYEPNQMEGMTPAVRAAYTPMSDTRFDDLNAHLLGKITVIHKVLVLLLS